MSAADNARPCDSAAAKAPSPRAVVDVLAKKGRCLRDGLSARHANDILLTLLSAETFLALKDGRGWTREQCRVWLLEVLQQQLLG